MLLYIWINKYKNIVKTGFNLSSYYEFSFSIEDESPQGIIRGSLNCKKNNNPKIFHQQIDDIYAIIGENGSGKSSIIEYIIDIFMTRPNYLEGFLVTDKYIFNRKEYDFGESISNIKDINLIEVLNSDLVNFNKKEPYRILNTEEISVSTSGQISTGHLTSISFILYSSLLNIDRVKNIEGIAGSTLKWVTDYWHYFDITTENCIVSDYHSLNINNIGSFISSESELLAFKSAESIRNLEFLSNDIHRNLPFQNNIKYVSIILNNFYQTFWESIEIFFADKNEKMKISKYFDNLKKENLINDKKLSDIESNIYESYIFGAMKYEFFNMMNNGINKRGNIINEIIELLNKSAQNANSTQKILENLLNISQFSKDISDIIFLKIKNIVKFILESTYINIRDEYSFEFPITNINDIINFKNLIHDEFIVGDDNSKNSFIFHIFSIEFVGLSSGEKDLLSMFGRLNQVSKNIPATQNEVIILLDEPEVTLHPQWQIKFVKLINYNYPKLFPNKKLQIIITSHSPILVSDLPKNNILFLIKDEKTGNSIVSDLENINDTFGANIHSLYADAFFLKDKGGAIGEFAKDKILNVIKNLKKRKFNDANYLKSIIDIIGEPLIQDQLLELFYNIYPEQRIEHIDDRISFLEKTLNELKKRKK